MSCRDMLFEPYFDSHPIKPRDSRSFTRNATWWNFLSGFRFFLVNTDFSPGGGAFSVYGHGVPHRLRVLRCPSHCWLCHTIHSPLVTPFKVMCKSGTYWKSSLFRPKYHVFIFFPDASRRDTPFEPYFDPHPSIPRVSRAVTICGSRGHTSL
jgi:hypothetical protein